MRRRRVSCESAEQAALYALGALDGRSMRALEEHAAGCAECAREIAAMRETAAALAHAVPEHHPPPRLRERVLKNAQARQAWKDWSVQASAPVHVVRSRDGAWQAVAAGVHAKQLYVDAAAETVTMLIRMEAGSTWPAHRHASPEQCFVLEGDLQVGDVVLHAGDYQCAALDSVHDVTRTEQGCLLLIVSSQHDELIA